MGCISTVCLMRTFYSKESRLKLGVWLLSVIGALLIVISCGAPYWQVNKTFDTNTGLWQSCNALTGCSDVKVYDDGNDELNAVRALMVIGIVVIGIVMFVDVGGICCDKKVAVPMLVLQIVAVACMAGALGLYTNKLENALMDWGWAYALGWAGVAIYGGGVIVVGVIVCGV